MTPLVWVLVAAIGALTGIVAAQVGLIAYIVRRPFEVADKLDAAREQMRESDAAHAKAAASWAHERERFLDQMDIAKDEQKIALGIINEHKTAAAVAKAAAAEAEKDRDVLLRAIADGKGAEASVAAAIRANLSRLQQAAGAIGAKTTPPATPPSGRR